MLMVKHRLRLCMHIAGILYTWWPLAYSTLQATLKAPLLSGLSWRNFFLAEQEGILDERRKQ